MLAKKEKGAEKMDLDTGIFVFEILGVIAFAFSGAILAIRKMYGSVGSHRPGRDHRCGRGIIRDVILGINPPMAFTSPEQTAIACLVSVVIFCPVAYCQKKGIDSLFHKLDLYMTIFDAVGLAALRSPGFRWPMATAMGIICSFISSWAPSPVWAAVCCGM